MTSSGFRPTLRATLPGAGFAGACAGDRGPTRGVRVGLTLILRDVRRAERREETLRDRRAKIIHGNGFTVESDKMVEI